MSRKLQITGITLVAALAAPSFAAAQDRGGRGHGGQRMVERMEMWDSNGDGQVTQEEVDGFRAARLAEFDADGDGSLSIDEYEALWLDALRERMVDQFQAHDDDGDGAVTVDEFGEDFARLVARMDRNGDGVLSEDDAQEQRRNGGRRGQGGDQKKGARGGDKDRKGSGN